MIGFDELPAVLRTRLPLDVRLYALFAERLEISTDELRAALGASTIGIRVAIGRMVDLGLLRRERSGNPKTRFRYIIVDPSDTPSLEAKTA